jgi:hypothetical protein
MIINTDGHNDARTNIRTPPSAAARQKLAPNKKITVAHAGRYEVAQVHRCTRVGSRKQDVKAFLREVVIVGQDFRQTFTAHYLHGDAIRKAVCLVRAVFVQG